MNRRISTVAASFILTAFGMPAAYAAASPQEAAQLKTTLTPFGATRAGNASGTIPAWTGGDSDAAGLSPNKNVPDKFAADRKVLTINSSNLEKYAPNLPAGAVALMKLHPAWHIDVYPTHRTGGAAPQWVYDNTFKNATNATLKGPNEVVGAFGGVPFPIPKGGREIMWNNNLHWEGTTSISKSSIWVVPPGGSRSLSGTTTVWKYEPYFDQTLNINNFNSVLALYRIQYSAPPQRDGEAIIAVNSINYSVTSKRVWQYLTGQRRLRLAPNLAYDTVYPDCGGFMNSDEDRIMGPDADRYDMRIVGKREMYIPYNVNKLANFSTESLTMQGYINPDAVRWELHRVWDVDLTVVPGARHVVPHRHIYFDEDTWEPAAADEYDAQGRLWKFNVAYLYNQPLVPTVVGYTTTIYDLLNGGYCFNQDGFGPRSVEYAPVPKKPVSFYDPSTVVEDASR